jgi:hypothetical protein
MTSMIKVIAREGVQVPFEQNPLRFITDAEVREVRDTAYYRRRIKDGDLLLYKDEETEAVGQPAAQQPDPAPAEPEKLAQAKAAPTAKGAK